LVLDFEDWFLEFGQLVFGKETTMSQQIKYEDEIIKEIRDMSDEQILNLLKIIRIFKKSIILQRNEDFYIKKEFDEWDTLSDEALKNFEGSL